MREQPPNDAGIARLDPAPRQRDDDRAGPGAVRDARLRRGQGRADRPDDDDGRDLRRRPDPGEPRRAVADRDADGRRGPPADAHILEYAARKQPLAGEMLDPDEVAKAAIYFLSDESRAVTGQSLAVDGGWSLVSTTAEPTAVSRATGRSRHRRCRRLRRRGGVGRVDARPSPRPAHGRVGPARRPAAVPRRDEHRRPRHVLRLLHAGRPTARKVVGGHRRRRGRRRCARSARSSSGRTRTAPGRASRTSRSTSRSSGSGSSTEAGARPLLHAMLQDAEVRDGRVDAVVVATRAGLARVRARIVHRCLRATPTCAPSPGSASRPPASIDPAQTLTTTFRMANVDLERRRARSTKDELHALMAEAARRPATTTCPDARAATTSHRSTA